MRKAGADRISTNTHVLLDILSLVLSLYCRRRCDDLSSPVKPLKKERRLELSLGTCLTVYVIVDLLCLVC